MNICLQLCVTRLGGWRRAHTARFPSSIIVVLERDRTVENLNNKGNWFVPATTTLGFETHLDLLYDTVSGTYSSNIFIIITFF